ncbi:hypothetical protein HGM15179_009022, partial [Zosterops borbonicus]
IPFLRVLITHLKYNCLPKSVFKERVTVGVLFFQEQGKEIAWHLESSIGSTFCHLVNWGSCLDPAVTWNKHTEDKNTVIIIYEDLKGNLAASVKQIAAFSGFSPTAEQIQAIAGRHTFQPGVFGDGKNVFTEAQNQKLATKFMVLEKAAAFHGCLPQLYLLQQPLEQDVVRPHGGWASMHLHPCKNMDHMKNKRGIYSTAQTLLTCDPLGKACRKGEPS